MAYNGNKREDLVKLWLRVAPGHIVKHITIIVLGESKKIKAYIEIISMCNIVM